MAVFTIEDCAASRSPGRLLRRLDKIMSGQIEAKFDGFDLSFQQWIALKVVRDGIVGNAGELSHELGITTGATTRMIDLLEARGLLSRDRTADDRRVVRLAITPEGRATVAKLQDDVVSTWNEVVADFTQQEAEVLVTLLAKLLAAAERVAGAGKEAGE
ncbi:MarR family winged helix-turn-helix transcriptional regulator [Sphingomonas sp. Sphisp140]|uniref:MarR family winged helix-turn-helix transcriptional regulator n=1 Tax=unclassified Sphingomonas TaxID=196159 RepID=UPI0039B0E997